MCTMTEAKNIRHTEIFYYKGGLKELEGDYEGALEDYLDAIRRHQLSKYIEAAEYCESELDVDQKYSQVKSVLDR